MKTFRFFGYTCLLLLQAYFWQPAFAQEYVLLGWNDLGMHCSNQYFGKIAVLPPYNTVTAQLIFKPASGTPQIVTGGYRIEYSIPGNTYSVGKTDFWTYAKQLFGLAQDLPPNIGLTGKGLTGVMDTVGNHFHAEGIPVTPFADNDLVNENPYQLLHLVAKRDGNDSVLAFTDVVIPVSNEVGCVQSGCHSSENNILNQHESVNGFNRNGPVLCASCHASNALGTTGNSEAGPFSQRIHEKHAGVAGPSDSVSTCYKCHPGPKTQCLRDVMGKNTSNPLRCQTCHGNMRNVAATISAGRRPWLDEPNCGSSTCHGSNYSAQAGKLYRMSEDHGGLYCSACHGSPHAIAPTVQPNDNLQNIRLQGHAGTLAECTVCHAVTPAGSGPHGIHIVHAAPVTPMLMAPPDGAWGVSSAPTVSWRDTSTVTAYTLSVASDPGFIAIVYYDSGMTGNSRTLPPLVPGTTYYWRVKAKNAYGYSDWSPVWTFTPVEGTSVEYALARGWRMFSLPLDVLNPLASIIFPFVPNTAYSYSPIMGYKTKDTLQFGGAYWIKAPASGTISVTGKVIKVDTIQVYRGWNMIGTVSGSVSIAGITSIPSGIVNSDFFTFNTGYKVVPTLEPAYGYWVHVSTDGLLILATP